MVKDYYREEILEKDFSDINYPETAKLIDQASKEFGEVLAKKIVDDIVSSMNPNKYVEDLQVTQPLATLDIKPVKSESLGDGFLAAAFGLDKEDLAGLEIGSGGQEEGLNMKSPGVGGLKTVPGGVGPRTTA